MKVRLLDGKAGEKFLEVDGVVKWCPRTPMTGVYCGTWCPMFFVEKCSYDNKTLAKIRCAPHLIEYLLEDK